MTPKKLHCPVKYFLVTLDKKLYNSVTFESGQKLYFDPSWHPEEYSMMEATVVGVPDTIGRWRASKYGWILDETYKDLQISGIQPGDKVLIRYDVVFNYIDQPEHDTPIYKNLFLYEGKEYWKCSVSQVFAYIRNGETRMINNWVMCDRIKEEKSISDVFVTPDNYKDEYRKDKMCIRHISPAALLGPGDIIYADPQYVQSYKINLDEFYILRQSRILAKVS